MNKQMAVAALVLMDDVMQRVQQENQWMPNVFEFNAIDDDETMRLAKDHFRAKKEQAKRASGPP